MHPTLRARATLLLIASGAAVACDSRPAPRHSLLAARGAAAPTPAAALGPVDNTPELAVDAACSDSVESAALRCAEGAASRHGDTLAIALTEGGTVTRIDEANAGEQSVSYGYAGRIGGASGTPVFHLVDMTSGDGYTVELINARTGDSLSVTGHPLLSPDGTRFAVAAIDLDSCDGSNALEVWRVTGDVPVRELSLQPWDCVKRTGWGASQIEWTARDTLDVLRNMPSRDAARRRAGGIDSSHVRFVRGVTGWALDPRAR